MFRAVRYNSVSLVVDTLIIISRFGFSDFSGEETWNEISKDETKLSSDEFDSEMGLSPIPGPPSPFIRTRTTLDGSENLEPRPDSSRDMFSDEEISSDDNDNVITTTPKDEAGRYKVLSSCCTSCNLKSLFLSLGPLK